MRKLTGLNARGRQISNLLGIEGAINLTELDLGKNNLQLQGLPAHVFQRMTKLTSLRLDQNRLGTNLPNGIFRGLTGLTRLWLQGNADGPGVQFEVRLETVGENGFKVVAPNGAPFDIKVGLLFNKVTAPTGSTLVTIPTGKVETEVFITTLRAGSTGEGKVTIANVSRLPTGTDAHGNRYHQGYFLQIAGKPATIKNPNPPTNNAPVFTEGATATRSIAENTASGTKRRYSERNASL